MMKKVGMGLAVCGLLLSAGCGGMGEPKEFTSVDGKYKVMMPGTPKEQTQSAAGIAFKVALVESKDGAVVVGYSDLPIPPNETDQEIQKRLDGAAQGMAANTGGKVESVSPITLAGKHPGREIKATIPNPSGVMRARVYLVGTRLYQVLIVGKSGFANSDNATKVLDSFQLTQ